MTRFCLRRLALPLLAVVCALLPLRAEAQLSRIGGSNPVIPGVPQVRGTDVAYDPVNNVFLLVQAYGVVSGVFVDAAGNAVSPYFTIASKAGAHAHYPRVTYGNGKFLVAWHENEGAANAVHVRTVAYPSTLGPEVSLGVTAYGSWWEAAPGVAYSTTSGLYLVVWQSYITNQVYGRRVDANGTPIGSTFLVSGAGNGRDPAVAWNPSRNEFGVSYSGWDAQSATINFARVRPTDGAILSRAALHREQGTFITSIVYSAATGNFVIGYAAPHARTIEVGPTGAFNGFGVTTAPVGTIDGLDLAYNPVSKSILLVGHSILTVHVDGFELNARGVAISSPVQLSVGSTGGSYYPQVAASSKAKVWSMSFSRDFGHAVAQAIQTTTADGTLVGGAPTGGSSTPPPPTGGTGGGSTSCGTPPSGMVCSIHGGFVPPNHPDAVKSGGSGGSTGGGTTTPAPPPPPPPPPATSCGTPPAGLVCSIYGGWVPANHPDAVKSGGSTGGGSTGGGTTQPGGCTTPSPGANFVCSDGGWVPTNHPSSPGLPTCTGAQLTGRPAPGWVRLPSGGWVPESHALASQGVCKG